MKSTKQEISNNNHNHSRPSKKNSPWKFLGTAEMMAKKSLTEPRSCNLLIDKDLNLLHPRDRKL